LIAVSDDAIEEEVADEAGASDALDDFDGLSSHAGISKTTRYGYWKF
jgi:hypothetical protein